MRQKLKKKLYWLEHSSMGGPLAPVMIFDAVGFEVGEIGFWATYDDSKRFTENTLRRLEVYQPDLVVFLTLPSQVSTVNEPPEWIKIRKHIRTSSNLQHTKIMALFGVDEIISEDEEIWKQEYDFFTKLPFRVIEYARIAKQLMGEQIEGFEGINYYLSLGGQSANGNWLLQDYLVNDKADKDESKPEAEGQFAYVPRTRLLRVDDQGKYTWQADGIQAKIPTYLVYLIKSLSIWREGLSISEMERLTYLAQQATPEHQLLIGANETLLQVEPEIIRTVLEQAQQAGGWRIFIIEHLWFEIVPNPDFDKVVYEGSQSFLMM